MKINDYILTKHAESMLIEREVPVQWITDCIENPDMTEWKDDDTLHLIKAITEYQNRFLRVVVNPYSLPKKIVTFFFDRRLSVRK